MDENTYYLNIGQTRRKRPGKKIIPAPERPELIVQNEAADSWRFTHAGVIRQIALEEDLNTLRAECADIFPEEIRFRLVKVCRDRIRFISDSDSPGDRIYIRIYHFCGNLRWVPGWHFRLSRAEKEREAALWLKEHGINSPDIISNGVFRRGNIPVGSYLIQKHLDGWKILKYSLAEDAEMAERFRANRGFEKLAELYWKLFENGAYFGQIGAGSVLLQMTDPDIELAMMDHEHILIRDQPITTACRVHLIARLNVNLGKIQAVTDEDRAQMFSRFAELDPRLNGVDFERFHNIIRRIKIPRTRLRGIVCGHRILRALGKH